MTGNDATLPVTMIFNYGNDCWFELDAFGLPAGEVVAVAESIRSVESEKTETDALFRGAEPVQKGAKKFF